MNELNYLNELVSNKSVIVPVNSATPVCDAACALGYNAHGGAIIEDGAEMKRVIYLD